MESSLEEKYSMELTADQLWRARLFFDSLDSNVYDELHEEHGYIIGVLEEAIAEAEYSVEQDKD